MAIKSWCLADGQLSMFRITIFQFDWCLKWGHWCPEHRQWRPEYRHWCLEQGQNFNCPYFGHIKHKCSDKYFVLIPDITVRVLDIVLRFVEIIVLISDIMTSLHHYPYSGHQFYEKIHVRNMDAFHCPYSETVSIVHLLDIQFWCLEYEHFMILSIFPECHQVGSKKSKNKTNLNFLLGWAKI